RCDHSQRKGDVVEHRHVRIERVALEHHRDVALAGLAIGDVLTVEEDAARAQRLDPGEDAQRCRLAGSRRPEQREEFARLDIEVEAVQCRERAVPLDDAAHADTAPGTCRARRYGRCAHRRPPPFTAPTVSPLTMCRCASSPRRITGAIASIAPAASFAHCVCSTEMKLNIATVTGRTRLPPSTTANRNSF